MGLIIFVHGMGHSSNPNYWQEWAAPLRAALAGEGLALQEEQFGGVYYYDLVPGPADISGIENIQVCLRALQEQAAGELSSLRAPFAGGIGAIKRLTGYIVNNFGDIFTYLYMDKTHRLVNERLYEAIQGSNEPVHLLGYSLGSIVCYCALQQNQEAAAKVAHFIMLGSPLFWLKNAVAERVSLESRPFVQRFTNLAGILDIAWPQAVPKIVSGLDENIEFVINPFDPISGHKEYFFKSEGVKTIARLIKQEWA